MQSLFIIHLYTNKIALKFTLLKQHIKKKVVLFKSLNSSPTCFGQFLTILREIFIFFTSVTKNKLFRFVVACLLYLLCFVLILHTLPSLVVVVVLQYNNNHAGCVHFIWHITHGNDSRKLLKHVINSYVYWTVHHLDS